MPAPKSRRPLAWILVAMLIAGVGPLLQHKLALGEHAQSGRLDAPIPVGVGLIHGEPVLAVFWLTMIGLAWCAWKFASTLESNDPSSLWLIVGGQLAVGLVLSANSLLLTPDPYAYVVWGRLLGLWHMNPYHVPRLGPNMDPALRPALLVWDNHVPSDPYGPLWTFGAGILAKLLRNAPMAVNLWSFRLVGLGAAVLATLALSRLRLSGQGYPSARRLALFALHPLVLYEAAAAGHGDIVMVALAACAFAVIELSPAAAGALLGASIAVKYASIVVLPFLLAKIARRNPFRAAICLLLVASSYFACRLPFVLAGWDVPLPQVRYGIAFSIMQIPLSLSEKWMRAPDVGAIAKALVTAFAVLLVAVWVIAIVLYWRKGNRGCVWSAIYAALGSLPNVFPWYVTWAAPAILEDGKWGAFAWWLCLFVFAQYVAVVPAQLSTQLLSVLIVLTITLPWFLASRERFNRQFWPVGTADPKKPTGFLRDSNSGPQ